MAEDIDEDYDEYDSDEENYESEKPLDDSENDSDEENNSQDTKLAQTLVTDGNLVHSRNLDSESDQLLKDKNPDNQTQEPEENILDDFKEDQVEEDPTIKEKTRIYRDNKFDTKGSLILYYENPIEIMKSFLKAYRYLLNLSNSLPENDDKLQIINKQIKNLKILNYDLLILFNRYNLPNNFGKYKIEMQIINLIEKNNNKICSIIDYVHSLGKVIKLYDPNENVGTY